MLKIGLTGSIAVGKSYVCEVFRELGAFVIDADQTARDVVALNSKGLRQIVDKFGEGILQENGELNRVKMASIVFADEEKRLLLNSIVHPLVFEAQKEWLAECERIDPNGIAIVDAALMIESGGYKRFTKLIVVWCDFAIQLDRLIKRNNFSEAEALKRINAQMPQEEKKKFADFLIDTSNGFEDTRRQVVEIYEQLRVL
ncbi:MAG TPA: dephospho-CoA kinase [Pyrinomonadaceae bacterium]|nr:dephospho-CoA kinase [Pyrinomonadaceae bacterium]